MMRIKFRMNEYEKLQSEFNKLVSQDCNTELWEMSMVARDTQCYIGVNPDIGRNLYNMEYFKVFNSPSFIKATKEARIKFRSSEYVQHRDNKKPWILNSKEKEHLIEQLSKPSKYEDNCMVWQYGIMQFNLEAYDISHKETRKITKEFQASLPEDDERKKYLPFDLEMPNYERLQK